MKDVPSAKPLSDQPPSAKPVPSQPLSNQPSSDPIDEVVASFSQSLFLRAREQSDVTRMTDNVSISPLMNPETPLASTMQQVLPVLNNPDRMGQVQSTPSSTQKVSSPHPQFGNSSFTWGRSHRFAFNASNSSAVVPEPLIKEEDEGDSLASHVQLGPSVTSFRPSQAIDTPRTTPLSSCTTDARTHGFMHLVNASLDENKFNFAISLKHEAKLQEIRSTPLFSNRVRLTLNPSYMRQLGSVDPIAFPQYGLLGICQKTYGNDLFESEALPVEDNFLMANMNTPWSAFICGSQGGGKSHTLSCLLEAALLTSSLAGENPKPLAGLVFHYDNFTSQESAQLCEAAYLCSSGVPVRVLVSPSNYSAMCKLYNNLPGLPEGSPKPQVVPLYLKEEHLNVSRMMTLMNMNNVEDPPLYMEVLYHILRDMAMQSNGNPGVNYGDFTNRLSNQGFSAMQNGPLGLRLSLLEAFLADRVQSEESSAVLDSMFKSAKGTLTIVDLSCPFVNENDACALFTICLSIFMEHRSECGRIVAIDEAHKFLTRTGEAKRLTEQLTSLIRQQRHLGTRVVISTQEPTLSPQLIDLCNVCVVHRFNSPSWFNILKDHLAGANTGAGNGKVDAQHLFDKIVALRTGEAFIFCPTALLDVLESEMVALKNGFLRVKVRARCSTDGGRSIMASDQYFSANIDHRRVSDIIRPYPRCDNPRATRGGRGGRGGSAVATSMPRATSSSTVNSSAPVSGPTGPGPARADTSRPAPISASNRPQQAQPLTTSAAGRRQQPQPSKDQISQALRAQVTLFMRANPRQIHHDQIRKAVNIDLNLPKRFFFSTEWLKLSREIIQSEASKYAEAYGLPQPKFG